MMTNTKASRSIGLVISRVKNKMRRKMQEQLKPYDLTPEQRIILLLLGENGGMMQSQLCKLTSAEPSNLSTTLKRLITKECIIKVDHPDDVRAYLVELTAKAKGILPELIALSSEVNGSLLKNVSDVDLETTLRTLNHIDQNLSKIGE